MDERTKKILEAERDPRILQALLAQALEHIDLQKKLIDRLEEEQREKDQLSFTIEERLKLLRRHMFGRSREEREASDRPRDKSQVEASLFARATCPAPETRDGSHKGKARGWALEEVIVDHHPSPEELKEESASRGVREPSSDQWTDTGLYDESMKITLIERRYVRELHRRYKYKLDASANPDPEKEVIVTAAGPAELLPGMNYSTDFVASVACDKYINHLPLERQTRTMESLGLTGVKTSTLSRLCGLAAASLELLAENIRQDLVASGRALHIDETRWQIQNKDEKDGYMWIIANNVGSYYFFKPTRSAQVIKEKLIGYDGPIVTDAYPSYDEVLREIALPHAYCWAHVRREFLPLEGHDPSVKPILDLIDEMFAVEREATSFEELGRLRRERTTPSLEGLYKLLEAEHHHSREGSQKRKAIEYATKRWAGLTLFVNDTRIPLSNNEAERTIRHAVVGRKNYYGAGSHAGAETAATLFTVIESCKKNDLDPRSFLVMSLYRATRGEELETPLAYARRTRSGNQPA